jgi:PAS domain S-box-containing protein
VPTSDTLTFDTFTFDVDVEDLASPARMTAIDETGLVDVRDDEVLDRLTRLAEWGTSAPIALVTLVEATRQVFLSARGLSPTLEQARETPLAQSFCQHVVLNGAPLVVDDARLHPALADHPGLENGVVAYAGYPVRHPDGTVLGTICAADSGARAWRSTDVHALADLASLLEADIARRVKQVAAERLHAQLQHVLDGAASTAIVAADNDGFITFANRGAAELLGLEPEQLSGPHRLDDLARLWHPVSGRGTPDGAEDWLITDADGHQRVVTARRTALHGDDGRVSGSMLLCDDVSARHRAETLLLETVRKQEAAVEQMKSLDHVRNEFIATASHELRTPVTSILGYAELLSEGAAGPLNGRQVELLGRVNRNSQRLLRLIGDLLALSQMTADEHEPLWTTVDVGAVARQAWGTLSAHLIGRTLDVRVDVPADPALVRGDAAEVERIVSNLLTNAVKYTPDGGAVEVTVRHTGLTVQVVVRDTGIGIDPHEVDRVFEPFFRAHDAQQRAIQGSGLGLALVQRLTKAHGGSVHLDSQPGVGTRVTVALPACS